MTPTTDEIMGQAQVFASAWALVGSRFDSGDGMDRAKGESASLRGMVEELTKERYDLKVQHALAVKAIVRLQYERDEYKKQMQNLMTTVAELKIDRDEYQQAADTQAMAHKVDRDALAQLLDQWRSDYYELRLERDALAADAERYRWMTEHIVSGDMDSLEKAFSKLDPYAESVTQAEFDAVIDSAIQAGVQ